MQVRHWLREAFDEVRDALAHRAGQVRRAVQGPGRERDVVVQIFKTVAAGVIAWEITANVVQAPTPFFAPLAAIAVVQATVARSVSEGWQQMVAVLAGVVLAFAVARLLGITAVSIALVLLVSLLIGRWNRLGNSGFQVPATALIMLIVAGQQSEASFVARLVETAIGLGVGLVLNALIAPPVHLGSLQTAVEDLAGEVEKVIRQLVDALRTKGPDVDAEQLLRRVRRLDGLVADAREAYDRAKESLHLNPDPRARRRSRVEVPLPRSKALIDALGDATDELRGIARTLLEAPTRCIAAARTTTVASPHPSSCSRTPICCSARRRLWALSSTTTRSPLGSSSLPSSGAAAGRRRSPIGYAPPSCVIPTPGGRTARCSSTPRPCSLAWSAPAAWRRSRQRRLLELALSRTFSGGENRGNPPRRRHHEPV